MKHIISSVLKVTWSVSRCMLLQERNSSSKPVASALRRKKAKSRNSDTLLSFTDQKSVRTIAGNGGNGCISFLHLWCNEKAGPDGGDGGNGGHVIFQACNNMFDLQMVTSVVMAEHGEKGTGDDCHGKCAKHTIIKVPLNTVIKNSHNKIVADLEEHGMMFIAARGGMGGKGNHFFVTDTFQAPHIAEYGAEGEDIAYQLEIRLMAHIGLIGFPNVGKSTLLQSISRARPKVAPYPFTTMVPYIGMIPYDDYESISVADMPGLIRGSHQNKGLGIEFLKHAERCLVLMFVIDLSEPEPWTQIIDLRNELRQFSKELAERPQMIVGNKIDLPEAQENMKLYKDKFDLPIIPISAKMGMNLVTLLQEMRILYDKLQEKKSSE